MRRTDSSEHDSGVLEPQEVRGQLARILTSPDFNVPERLRSFLTFVIEEFLAGRGDRVKAYAIATHVFGRSDDFDVQNDPVVRIEAGRLRRALERYYLTGGLRDPILIDIPKGGYAPDVKRREINETARNAGRDMSTPEAPFRTPMWRRAARGRPALWSAVFGAALCLVAAVAWVAFGKDRPEPGGMAARPEVNLIVSPFVNLSDSDGTLYSTGIFDELITRLAQFKDLKVVSREAGKVLGREFEERSGPAVISYLLEGGVRVSGKHLRVSSRLLDGKTAEIIWSQVYDRDLQGSERIDIESDIATKVATAVAQPYGAIFAPSLLSLPARVPPDAQAYTCMLHFYRYRREPTAEEHRLTRSCLEKTVAQSPGYATGLAMLAYLYLDEDRFEFNRERPAPAGKVRAREVAERAVRLDPSNARALQALMTVLFYSKEPEAAFKLGEQALALNPNDTEVLAEFGSRLAQSGDRGRGLVLIEEAVERNPNQTRYFIAILAQNYYLMGDNERALYWIRRAKMNVFSNYHFVAALIFARANLMEDAKAAAQEFLRMRPRFFDNFEEELTIRNYSSQDRRILIEGARQAGFPVSEAAL